TRSEDRGIVSYVDVNGARYHLETQGDGPPLVLLHGFTGSGRSWTQLVRSLRIAARTIAIDLLGHGLSDSPSDASRYAIGRAVEDLLEIFDRLELPRVNLLGYSMGGRVALSLAVAAPNRLDSLILESASDGLSSPDERAERVRSDAALAAIAETEGIVAFVDRWEKTPLFSTQKDLPSDVRRALREQRLRSNPTGLANCLRGMGTGTMEPLSAQLGTVSVRTLLIVGALDLAYLKKSKAMAAAMPAARLVVIPAAGHAIHLEQPVRFAKAVAAFLAPTPETGLVGENKSRQGREHVSRMD
ncbi:MAG TPA: 2-succinyl-6-hydroxy-2,4-cyclohexadiene-1-carboxylate synthase, partial [Chloroflexota bacterium]|nr:2-succinyl-6-hydroxy-2,4-cyclohexadiene-1-carboxylate synthase [Chloroflexota bacterium]